MTEKHQANEKTELLRTVLAPGVALTQVPAERFKNCSISITFSMPGRRETATAYALLPLLLERGYADCPDMTQLSKKLARLYGAELGVSTVMVGALRALRISVTGIKNKYAVLGENLLEEYLDLLFGVAFRPDVENGSFHADAVEIEKDKLKEIQQGEINDKRRYCFVQTRRRFYGAAGDGLERYGYPDEVDAITGQELYRCYCEMLKTAKIEAIAVGLDGSAVAEGLLARLQGVRRRLQHMDARLKVPAALLRSFTEPVDSVQGKLCMAFTTRRALTTADLAAVRLAVALLGGMPTSRLFMNVREKQSLCYYCSAGFHFLSGCLMIDSGIEPQNAEKAKNAILHELQELAEGTIPLQDMEDAKRYLDNALKSVFDSISGIVGWTANEIDRGTLETPEEVSAAIQDVSEEQVQKILQNFNLNVVYLLTKEGAAE